MGRRRGAAGAGTPALAAVVRAGARHRVHELEGPHASGHQASGHHAFGDEAADELASRLGVAPERVFKTLVVRVPGSDGRPGYALAVVPVPATLDLGAAAGALGVRKVAMAPVPDAERVTGSVRGGIAPLGSRRRLDVLLDDSARRHETVFCSAGRRNLELEIAPGDLASLTGATVAPIAAWA